MFLLLMSFCPPCPLSCVTKKLKDKKMEMRSWWVTGKLKRQQVPVIQATESRSGLPVCTSSFCHKQNNTKETPRNQNSATFSTETRENAAQRQACRVRGHHARQKDRWRCSEEWNDSFLHASPKDKIEFSHLHFDMSLSADASGLMSL